MPGKSIFSRIARRAATKLKLLSKGFRYRAILRYVDIDGWLSVEEAVLLYDLARSLPDDGPVLVEIGSWQGKSSLVLAKAIRRKNSPKLYCIDPFSADGDAVSKTGYEKRKVELRRPLKDVFLDNMKRAGVDDLVTVVEGYSFSFAKKFFDPIDLVFIDGNHEYDAVLQDFCDWSPLVKPGGIIAFYDVNKSPTATKRGPKLVVEQRILGSVQWTDTQQVGSLFVARRATL